MKEYLEQRSPLQDNFLVVYSELKKQINEVVLQGYDPDKIARTEAFLTASVHAYVDYADQFLQEDDRIKAFKYANNSMKHNRKFETFNSTSGGLEFPICFPMEISAIKVRWASINIEAKHADQKQMYDKLLKGQEVLTTFEPVEEIISKGLITKPQS
jgi:hypothetical protein